MALSKKDLIKHFKISALAGHTRISLTRYYKNNHGLTDDQIEWLLEACNFNTEPNKINYTDFYNNNIIKEATFIDNPHVQLYSLPEFISSIDRSKSATNTLIFSFCITPSTHLSVLIH